MVLCVLGLLGGMAVSTFSKTLALLFGMLVLGVQVRRQRVSEMHRCCADESTVSRAERVQHNTDIEDTKVCERDRPAICNRR